jgi:hypothetical protein
VLQKIQKGLPAHQLERVVDVGVPVGLERRRPRDPLSPVVDDVAKTPDADLLNDVPRRSAEPLLVPLQRRPKFFFVTVPYGQEGGELRDHPGRRAQARFRGHVGHDSSLFDVCGANARISSR